MLENYVRALGGREALAKVTTRVVRGSRVGADGVLVPEEIYQKAPDKLSVMTCYPNVTFRSGLDGARAWARDSRGADQLNDQFAEALRREAEFYNGVRLRELYPKMTAVGRETVGGRETYVVSASASDGGVEKFYFDAQTGLLVRRYVEFKPLGGRRAGASRRPPLRPPAHFHQSNPNVTPKTCPSNLFSGSFESRVSYL